MKDSKQAMRPIPLQERIDVSMAISVKGTNRVLMAFLILGLNLPLISNAQRVSGPARSVVTFEEVPDKVSGITWVHDNAHPPERFLPETVGAGCAFIDYDNDGWMDIYLVNSGGSDFYTPATPLKNALYHNNHDGTFTDVTNKAGVAGGTFGMGVAVADYDRDGWVDLYVTSYGKNILFHNNGNGTFTDVTDKAGVAAPGWSTCAVWFDYDRDGKLDLFVSSFVYYDKSQITLCTDETLKRRYYCVPRLFEWAWMQLTMTVTDGRTSLLLTLTRNSSACITTRKD